MSKFSSLFNDIKKEILLIFCTLCSHSLFVNGRFSSDVLSFAFINVVILILELLWYYPNFSFKLVIPKEFFLHNITNVSTWKVNLPIKSALYLNFYLLLFFAMFLQKWCPILSTNELRYWWCHVYYFFK